MYGQDLDSLSRIYIQDFKETFKNEDFKIGDYTLTETPESAYLNIEIIPQREGVHFVKQIFEYESGYGYKNNSLLNIIKAGKKGSPRYFTDGEPNPFISNTCSIGDTIVIPVFWSSHVINNKFSTGDEEERKIWGKIDSPAINKSDKKIDWNIDNKVNELKVIDIISSYAIHRGLGDETVKHSLIFEVAKSGDFLLVIGENRLPLIIYPQESSIKKFVTQVVGTQWDDRATSSSLPPDYKKETSGAVMRVGDTLNYTFSHYVQEVKNPRTINLNIEINKMQNSKK